MIPSHVNERTRSNHAHAVSEMNKALSRAAHIIAVAENNLALATIQHACEHLDAKPSGDCCGGKATVCPTCGFTWI